jgi:hypothetical protein
MAIGLLDFGGETLEMILAVLDMIPDSPVEPDND